MENGETVTQLKKGQTVGKPQKMSGQRWKKYNMVKNRREKIFRSIDGRAGKNVKDEARSKRIGEKRSEVEKLEVIL